MRSELVYLFSCLPIRAEHLMNKKTVKDIDLKGKRVLMRVDLNVPYENGVVSDATARSAARWFIPSPSRPMPPAWRQ